MANLVEAGRSLGDRFFPAMKFPDYRRLWMALGMFPIPRPGP